jgi:hypothetical protein
LTLLSIVVINHRLHSMRLDREAGAVGAGVISVEMNVGVGHQRTADRALHLARWTDVEEARSTMPTVFLIQNVIALRMLGLTRGAVSLHLCSSARVGLRQAPS